MILHPRPELSLQLLTDQFKGLRKACLKGFLQLLIHYALDLLQTPFIAILQRLHSALKGGIDFFDMLCIRTLNR